VLGDGIAASVRAAGVLEIRALRVSFGHCANDAHPRIDGCRMIA
jgi:hypothetical protein